MQLLFFRGPGASKEAKLIIQVRRTSLLWFDGLLPPVLISRYAKNHSANDFLSATLCIMHFALLRHCRLLTANCRLYIVVNFGNHLIFHSPAMQKIRKIFGER